MKKEKKFLKYFNQVLENDGIVHMTLLDPDPFKMSLDNFDKVVTALTESGTDVFMVGGSTAIDTQFIDTVVQIIKENSDLPVILFPGSISGVSKKADAIFFLSPLNSRNWYFLIGAQMLVAPFIKKWGIEPISLAYLIFEPGGTAGYVSDVAPIPRNKPEIAIAYASAAELIGFDLVYLEAGSGSPEPIPAKVVAAVSKFVEIPIIVGGGIRSYEQAVKIVKAGASAIVQGTKFEEAILSGEFEKFKNEFRDFISAIKKAKKAV